MPVAAPCRFLSCCEPKCLPPKAVLATGALPRSSLSLSSSHSLSLSLPLSLSLSLSPCFFVSLRAGFRCAPHTRRPGNRPGKKVVTAAQRSVDRDTKRRRRLRRRFPTLLCTRDVLVSLRRLRSRGSVLAMWLLSVTGRVWAPTARARLRAFPTPRAATQASRSCSCVPPRSLALNAARRVLRNRSRMHVRRIVASALAATCVRAAAYGARVLHCQKHVWLSYNDCAGAFQFIGDGSEHVGADQDGNEVHRIGSWSAWPTKQEAASAGAPENFCSEGKIYLPWNCSRPRHKAVCVGKHVYLHSIPYQTTVFLLEGCPAFSAQALRAEGVFVLVQTAKAGVFSRPHKQLGTAICSTEASGIGRKSPDELRRPHGGRQPAEVGCCGGVDAA